MALMTFNRYYLRQSNNVGGHTRGVTSRRDLLQRLVPCNVYTMGLVAGTSPLKGLHAGNC